VLIAGLQLISVAAFAGQARVNAMNFVTDMNSTKMVFNVSESVKKGVFVLDNPMRLVIDLKNTRLDKALPQPDSSNPLFSKVRSAQRNDKDLRIVVDLKKPFPAKWLKTSADKEARQVVVGVLTNDNTSLVTENTHALGNVKYEADSKATDVESSEHNISVTANHHDKNIVVAIDAGHGGNDSGAQGPSGTQEKKVVFAIAKKLALMINSQVGMRAVLVRKGDYYIGLRRRMEIAREAKADLFVSIHADAINDASVKGASVYTLSNTGASSEAARWLADNENAADLVGGVRLDNKDDVLASVLLDLSQSATKEASKSVASKILKHFNAMGKLHKNEVQKANFMVLKSPDIPSILVETAFISNPSEENELRSAVHQEKMAEAVFKGITSYFKEYAPAGTRIASLR
jgi:N-acetylmuramoyl-L-alanine amidase